MKACVRPKKVPIKLVEESKISATQKGEVMQYSANALFVVSEIVSALCETWVKYDCFSKDVRGKAGNAIIELRQNSRKRSLKKLGQILSEASICK